MVKPKIKLPSRRELLIVGGIWLLVLGPIIWKVSGPRGHDVPKQPPDEANRIRHPAGFSIVAPPNWRSETEMGSRPFSGMLVLFPLSPIPRRWSAWLNVSCFGQERPSDLAGLKPTTFQGHEAYEQMRILEEGDAERPDRSQYVLVVHCVGRWYQITYRILEARTTLPDMIRRYVATVRWE